uniref:Uncharacterized protein n=1 Tax=Cannabis sativa TaxID=3483 RepID=A0A803QZG8_CANSA
MDRSKSLPSHYSNLHGDARFDFEERSKSYSFNGDDDLATSSSNPEMKRRKRVAAYNMYATEEMRTPCGGCLWGTQRFSLFSRIFSGLYVVALGGWLS